MAKVWRAAGVVCGALLAAGACGPTEPQTSTEPLPGTPAADAGKVLIQVPADAGALPGPDAGAAADAGAPPAPDAGSGDAGIVFGTPGPWQSTNVVYKAADGILETPVVGLSTDESQNRWLATPQALYLLKPGETQFRRYAAPDGLHLAGNPVAYCDNNFPGPGVCAEDPSARCPVYGAASDRGITEIVGGGPNEVFVGYAGIDEGTGDWCDPNRHSGKLDRVRLQPDGTLVVDRIDLVSNDHGAKFWHNRTVERLVFDHFTHKHELYVGANHGVTLLRPDAYRKPAQGEWFDKANQEYMADHLHPRVCNGAPCDPNSESNQLMGDWRGLALAPDGDLWVAGKWTAGKIRWHADLHTWFSRNGENTYAVAFGDPYPVPDPGNGFINQPVFRVAEEGDPVYLTGVAVGADGRVWFTSGPNTTKGESLPDGGTTPVMEYGLGAWTGKTFQYVDPVADLGASERNLRDIIALPDGRLVIALKTSGLILWNPTTGQKTALRAPDYLPDDGVVRLHLDTMVSPPALNVATRKGAAVIRVFP